MIFDGHVAAASFLNDPVNPIAQRQSCISHWSPRGHCLGRDCGGWFHRG
jgi:hypothetical protein